MQNKKDERMKPVVQEKLKLVKRKLVKRRRQVDTVDLTGQDIGWNIHF